jgi:hypothetical protein
MADKIKPSFVKGENTRTERLATPDDAASDASAESSIPSERGEINAQVELAEVKPAKKLPNLAGDTEVPKDIADDPIPIPTTDEQQVAEQHEPLPIPQEPSESSLDPQLLGRPTDAGPEVVPQPVAEQNEPLPIPQPSVPSLDPQPLGRPTGAKPAEVAAQPVAKQTIAYKNQKDANSDLKVVIQKLSALAQVSVTEKQAKVIGNVIQKQLNKDPNDDIKMRKAGKEAVAELLAAKITAVNVSNEAKKNLYEAELSLHSLTDKKKHASEMAERAEKAVTAEELKVPLEQTPENINSFARLRTIAECCQIFTDLGLEDYKISSEIGKKNFWNYVPRMFSGSNYKSHDSLYEKRRLINRGIIEIFINDFKEIFEENLEEVDKAVIATDIELGIPSGEIMERKLEKTKKLTRDLQNLHNYLDKSNIALEYEAKKSRGELSPFRRDLYMGTDERANLIRALVVAGGSAAIGFGAQIADLTHRLGAADEDNNNNNAKSSSSQGDRNMSAINESNSTKVDTPESSINASINSSINETVYVEQTWRAARNFTALTKDFENDFDTNSSNVTKEAYIENMCHHLYQKLLAKDDNNMTTEELIQKNNSVTVSLFPLLAYLGGSESSGDSKSSGDLKPNSIFFDPTNFTKDEIYILEAQVQMIRGLVLCLADSKFDKSKKIPEPFKDEKCSEKFVGFVESLYKNSKKQAWAGLASAATVVAVNAYNTPKEDIFKIEKMDLILNLLVNPLINGTIDTGREHVLEIPRVANWQHKEILSEALKVFGRAGARGLQQYLKMSYEGKMSPEDLHSILIFTIASALKESLGAANQYSVKDENWLSSKEGVAVIYQDIFFQELTKRLNEKIEQKETCEAHQIALLNDQIAHLSFLTNSAKKIDEFMHNDNNLIYTNMEFGAKQGALESQLRSPEELNGAVGFWAHSYAPPQIMGEHTVNKANAAALELLKEPIVNRNGASSSSARSSAPPVGDLRKRPSTLPS